MTAAAPSGVVTFLFTEAHPTTNAMQAFLDSGGDKTVCVVIGQEGVVRKRRPLTLVIQLRRVRSISTHR